MDQLCPNCCVKLQPLKVSEGVVWKCDGCRGLSANVALLRRHSEKGRALQLWRAMQSSTTVSVQRCPGCTNPMTKFDVERIESPDTTVSLAGCGRCQVFWFDRGDLDLVGLSFNGPVRESSKVPIPRHPDAVSTGVGSWDGAGTFGYGGFDGDCGDGGGYD